MTKQERNGCGMLLMGLAAVFAGLYMFYPPLAILAVGIVIVVSAIAYLVS